jgi:hypothetical protein
VDIALEVGHLREKLCFLEDGFFASDGDRSALVVCYRAEVARAVTAANVIDGEFNLFNSRNATEGLVRGMIISLNINLAII